MCRALRVLCAARDERRLAALRLATASARWELVGGAVTLGELEEQLSMRRPDVVVLEEPAEGWVARVRDVAGTVRIVVVGAAREDEVPGEIDARADSLEGVRDAVLGVPGPGGPIRR